MATLSIAELRKRNNFTIFRDRIKTNGKFTISEGNGQKIQITQKFAYEFDTIQDLERFKDNRGTILLPTGVTGSGVVRLSQLYKDSAFVTRTQNTNAKEDLQIRSVREQLENMIHVYEEHINALEKENKQLKAQVDFLKEQLAYKTFGKPLDLEEEE